MVSKRELSVRRALELKKYGDQMLEENALVPSGLEMTKTIQARISHIRSVMGASLKDWNDWCWQIENRISNVTMLNKIMKLSNNEKKTFIRVGEEFRWATSPYFASLIDTKNPNCPIRAQCLPAIEELMDTNTSLDPMGEETTSPVPAIVRRYPDRLIINVTNECPSYCRHCQRRRRIGQKDHHTSDARIQEALDYIRDNPEIRDVLITGGDALMLDDDRLDWLLGQLDEISTVEIKRIGSRTISTLPYRITPALVKMLSKHHPLFINTQVNHPIEITREMAKATDLLTRVGIPLGNQAVLLAGVNDSVMVQRKLNQTLLKVRIRPYYLFHCKAVRGISHFRTSVDVGIEIMENLRGHTSGLAIPYYVVNSPGGLGKTPIAPDYIISRGKDHIVLRTWEWKAVEYKNPSEDGS